MEIKIKDLVSLGKISFALNIPKTITKQTDEDIVVIKKINSKEEVSSCFKTIPAFKIKQVLKLVQLSNDVLTYKINELTILEQKKLSLALALLSKKKIFIMDHFFSNCIHKEVEYFMWLIRTLVLKQKKSVVILEEDMDFICEYARKVLLYTKNEIKVISDFYDEELYKYVQMPKTVELIKYFETKGHSIDHEITFNETLKAIYRGIS